MYNHTMQKLGEERSAIRELFEYGNAAQARGEQIYDFSIGNPSAPPPAQLTETLRSLLGTTPERLHAYTSAPGAQGVREAVANHIRTAYGVPMSADGIYMTCGASASLIIALSAVLNAGEEVIVPAPYFPEYAVFVAAAGGKLVPVPTTDAFRLDLDAIARAVTDKTRAVLINSPNNPTGAVYGEEEMRALGDLLRKKSAPHMPILLLADEPYRELCYTPRPPVYPMAVYENTVVLYSFSKSLTLAGERIGYIAVSPQCEGYEALFAAVCGAGRAHGYVCAPALFQYAVKDLLGQSSDLSLYRENRTRLYGALTDMGYRCVFPEGAFYLFVKALEEDAAAFSERAKGYGILVVPSDSFGVKGYVRISYCVPRERIEKSLPAFAALIASYRA